MTLSLKVRRSAVYAFGTMLALAANTERAVADVVGPGSLTASASLAGALGPGQHNAVSPLFMWTDFLFANPGMNDPGYRVLFTIVYEGSNPTSSSNGSSVNTHGEFDFATSQNILSQAFPVFDPQFTSHTFTYSMPLYAPGVSNFNGNLTDYRMLLQTFAMVNGSTGSSFSTASNFSANLLSIRAVDSQGNDITSQIGLRSASGFMGSAPEPSTFVLMAGGLILLPLANSSFRKRLLNRSV